MTSRRRSNERDRNGAGNGEREGRPAGRYPSPGSSATESVLENKKTDCRHFRWDRPCAPHKATGVVCESCEHDYDPIERRLLVVKLAALGDVLRTTAFLPAMRRALPRARITWLTAPGAVELFDGNPLVDEVLSTGSAITASRLAVERFDVVLCPDADPDAAVLAAAAHADQRRGFTMDPGGRVVPLGKGAEQWLRMGLEDGRKRANRSTYQKLVADVLELDPEAIAEPILEPSADDVAAARRWRDDLRFDGALVGLNTGAGGRWERKQWTYEHQRSATRAIARQGVGVVLLGGPSERERNAALRADAAGLPVFDAGTDHSVRAFAARVDHCGVLITGDTFALHVGCARKVPVVALFGPTSSAEIELYGRGEKIVPEGLACLCCYLPTCTVSPHCQERITPERVVAAALRWLRPRQPVA